MQEITDVDELHKVGLNMLTYINNICEKNKIDYFAISGTLLGAIRHNGFIPWDDDIDIACTRENYFKLIKAIEDDKNERYKVMTLDTEGYYWPYAKLCDTYTVAVEKNAKTPDDYGAFIDIFYYDKLPDNNKIIHKAYIKGKRYMKYIGVNVIETKVEHNNIFKQSIRKIIYIFTNLFNAKKIIRHYQNIHYKYTDDNGKFGISIWPCYSEEKEIQLWNNLTEIEDHKFENITIKVPKNYDDVLKIQFGDYMKLPKKEFQKRSHNIRFYYKEEF